MYWLLMVVDAFFWLFHTGLILFNVLGWIWPRTRVWNLMTLVLTAVSWLVMGLWNGIGYCVCTDLHFQIREQLGIYDNANSYIQLLVFKLSGWQAPILLLNRVAGIVFGISLLVSTGLNIRDRGRQVGNGNGQAEPDTNP